MLECSFLLRSAIGLFLLSIAISAKEIISNPAIPRLSTFDTAAVPFIAFPSFDAQLIPLPNAAPATPSPAKAAPPIAPPTAPEKAPSSNPSRKEPPWLILSSPPATPPITAPVIAPQQAPTKIVPPIPAPTPVAINATATTTITAVAINFQCFAHLSAAFSTLSTIFSIVFFSQSGFK